MLFMMSSAVMSDVSVVSQPRNLASFSFGLISLNLVLGGGGRWRVILVN